MGPAPDIQRLVQRDEEAWSSLHQREFPFLYRFAIGMGAEPALAEDCASEAFIRLVAALPRLRFDSANALRAWLIVTCRNYLRDQFRKKGHADATLMDGDIVAVDVDPLTRVALSSALASLPDQQREVVVMRFVLGMPTSEVAAASGRGVKAVESLQHRALEALRRSPLLRQEKA